MKSFTLEAEPDTLTREELYEEYGPADGGPHPLECRDITNVHRNLYIIAEREKRIRKTKKYLARLTEYLKAKIEHEEEQKAYVLDFIHAWMNAEDETTVALPFEFGGATAEVTLRRRKQNTKQWADNDRLVEYSKAMGIPVRVNESPDKKAIEAHQKANPTLFDEDVGVLDYEEEERCTVTLPDALFEREVTDDLP